MSTTAPPSRRRRAPRRGRRPKPRCARSGWPSSSARSRRAPISRSSSRRRGRATRRSTMCCSSARRGSARPRWRRSSRASSASTSAPPPGPVIAKAGDLAALLTNLEERDVLFIDEIHRLNPAVEEILYPAMEDFQLDLIIGEGPAARSVKIDLAEVHAGRRDHARGAAHQSAARPLRHSGPAQFLHRGGARADRQPRRARARHRHDARTAPTRSRGARAARRASPGGCCAACATSPMSAGVDAIDRKLADRALLAARGRRRRPRRHGPALSHDDRRELRRRPGRGRDASRPRCRSRATPSRRSSSRS